MSILIKGVNMPEEGHLIVRIYASGEVCEPTECAGVWGKVATAVHVPPHFDLIDHNALKIAVMDCDAQTRIDFLKHAMDCINKAPVVIPSDMPLFEPGEGDT